MAEQKTTTSRVDRPEDPHGRVNDHLSEVEELHCGGEGHHSRADVTGTKSTKRLGLASGAMSKHAESSVVAYVAITGQAGHPGVMLLTRKAKSLFVVSSDETLELRTASLAETKQAGSSRATSVVVSSQIGRSR